MIRRFAIPLLAAISLSALGCGLTGESTLDAMKRRAKAQADANQEAEKLSKQRIAKAADAFAKATGKSPSEASDPVSAKSTAAKSAPAEVLQSRQIADGKTATTAAGGQSLQAIRPPVPSKPEPPLNDIQRRNKSAENLDQIIKALNQYARERGTYPTQAIANKRLGQPLLSWRVEILPYLGHAEFYREFKQNEAWDSPHNLTLLPHIPAVYVSPERCDEKTNYLAPHGPGAAWHGIRGTDPLSYADGADTTLVVLEADESAAVPWTKPEDLPTYDKLRSRLGNLRGEGFLATFGSGYVALIHSKISDAQLAWMLSTDGDDFLADRTIIFDATVPDVALVTNDEPPNEASADAPDGVSPKPDDAVASSGGSSAVQRPSGRTLPAVLLPTPPPKPERLPVPPEDDLAQARERLRELYEPEYRQRTSPGVRQKLAVKMLAEATRLENESAAYYELLRMVREISMQTGDVTTTLKAVEFLETKFELPPLELRLASLEALSGVLKDSNQSARQLATEAEKVLVAAWEADDYPQALAAHKIQLASLRKTSDRAKFAKAATAKAMLLEAEQAHKLVPAALSALAGNAENTEANGVAGNYYCLVKNDWEIGLPMLARGEDLKLRILARMDLDPDKSGPQHVQLADQYWDLARDYKQPQRRALELRAAFHYAAARPLLTGGVDLVKAEKRLEEVGRTYGKGELAKAAGAAIVLPMPLADPQDDSG